jgi:hypothetical protein
LYVFQGVLITKRFRDKYRVSSTRIPWFDYGSNAAYYITIFTKNRKPYLGLVENDFMVLSEIGEIVKDEWHKTPSIRPELNLYMDDLVIAPDHIHGIINRRDARPGVSSIKRQTWFSVNVFPMICSNSGILNNSVYSTCYTI